MSPVYEHFCQQCDTITDHFCSINERKQFVPCQKCGSSAERIISSKGAIRGDDMPAWMRHHETLGCLQSAGDKHRITTRSEYNRYLKERNIAEYSAKSEF